MDNPRWGQLGCNGFIVLDADGGVACRATAAYLDVGERAFAHVESLLDGMLGGVASDKAVSKKARQEPPPAAAPCANEPVAELGPIQSVHVAALDAEHDACAAALKELATTRSLAALDKVLSAYEVHFAHEEALLDEHLWKDAATAAKNGGGEGGFDAKASMRRTHLADHARMINEIAPGYAKLARATGSNVSRDSPVLPPAMIERAMRDFEAHANKYDSYGEELAAALQRAGEAPAAVVAVA